MKNTQEQMKNTQEHSRTLKNMKNTIAFRENISNLYNALKEEVNCSEYRMSDTLPKHLYIYYKIGTK